MTSPAADRSSAGDEPAEERILRATMDALARLDPAELSIKRICTAAAVTAPTLYYHFGNKDQLLAAAVERFVADWLAVMDRAVSRDAPLDVTLEQAVTAWTEAIVAPPRPLVVFSWATLLLADSSELARTALIRARDRGQALIEAIVALHVEPAAAVGPVSEMIVDSVIASAVQYELERDPEALRQRLASVGTAMRLLAAQVELAD